MIGDNLEGTWRSFIVPKAVICGQSDLFKAAFGGSSKEATNPASYKLVADAKVFDKFLEWLYLKKVEGLRLYYDQEFKFWDLCVSLHKLGDKIGVKALQDYIMRNLISAVIHNVAQQGRGFLPTCELAMELYASTPASSKLKVFLVGVYAFHPNVKLDRDLPMELVAEVGLILKTKEYQANKQSTTSRMNNWFERNCYH